MPKVQIERLEGPQIQQATANFAPIKAVQQQDNTAANVERVVGVAAKVYETEKKNADQIRVMEADKNLAQFETQLLYDPENGALNKKGSAAFGAVDEVDKAYSAKVAELEAGLSGDQQLKFRAQASTRQIDVSRSLNKHVAVERQKYDLDETTASIQIERDAAIANPMDLERVNTAVDRQVFRANEYAQRNHVPPEVLKQSILEIKSKTHAGVMEAMLAQGNDMAASQYFESVKDEVVGQQKTKLVKDLEEGSLRGESQRKSDEIFSKAKSMSEGLEMAKEIKDPKLRDQTSDRVKQSFANQDAARRDMTEKTMLHFGNIVDQGRDPRGMPGWGNLSPSEKTNIDNYYKHKQAGTEPRTDMKKYYDLVTMASDPSTRKDFAQTDLFSKYRNSLDDKDFKTLANLQASVRQNDAKVTSQLDGMRGDMAIQNESLAAAGVKVNSKNTEDKEKVAAFHKLIEQQSAEFMRANGKKPNNVELQEIVDRNLIKVVETGALWDSKKPLFLVDPNKADIKIADIKAAERTKIEAALKAKGRPVSDDEIIKLFKRKNLKAKDQ